MKTKILTILHESDGYTSGQQLCSMLGVSRTAIWKVMGQLKEEGYEIEAVQNKGYKLIYAPDILSESEIKSGMHTEWAGQTVVYKEETGSTNNDCKRLLVEGMVHGTLVVADRQTSGKGRRGRNWISPPGSSIYMTLGLKPNFLPDKASMLTLVMALAVCRAIEEETKLETQIKWPNDIVVNKKKVCGILTEMDVESDYINSVVIGVGINVNQEQFEDEIVGTATSLKLEKGETVNRAKIIQNVMNSFECYYEKFVNVGNLSPIMGEYNAKLANCNAQVRVLDPQGEYEGTAQGINELGELLVTRTDGTVVNVYAGEVSVRGIYGYV